MAELPPRIPPLIRDTDPELAYLEYAVDDAKATGDPQRIARTQGIRDKAVTCAAVQWAEPEPEAG
jgi:hypothetical protein